MLSQLLQPGEENSGDEFADNGQERDTPVVIAVAHVSFVLIQCDDVLII